jgi:hypothetical protein
MSSIEKQLILRVLEHYLRTGNASDGQNTDCLPADKSSVSKRPVKMAVRALWTNKADAERPSGKLQHAADGLPESQTAAPRKSLSLRWNELLNMI